MNFDDKEPLFIGTFLLVKDKYSITVLVSI